MLTASTISMIHCFVLMLTYLSWHLLNQHMYLCWLILQSFTVSVQWKRLPTSNEPPPPRAYHSMTSIGSRFLLFGGFDGKNTFGDLWWLVPEGTVISCLSYLKRNTSFLYAWYLEGCVTTGSAAFAECRPHSAMEPLPSAKALPSAALGKAHSAKKWSAKESLSSATWQALGKGFAECHTSTRQR